MAKGLMQSVTWRSSALILSETALIMAAATVSTCVVLGGASWSLAAVGHMLPKVLLIAYTCQLCLYYGDLYDDPKLMRDLQQMVVRLLQALRATSIVLAPVYGPLSG